MTRFAPGWRPFYVAALVETGTHADRVSDGAGSRFHAAARLLEMDEDGTISLDDEPALRELVRLASQNIYPPRPRYWSGEWSDSPRPERHGVATFNGQRLAVLVEVGARYGTGFSGILKARPLLKG